MADLLQHILQSELIIRFGLRRSGLPGGETFGHGRGIANGDFSGGEEGVELFADSAVVVPGDRLAEGEGFEGNAPKGFRIGRTGDDDIARGHNFAEVAAVSGEGDVFFQFCSIDGGVEGLIKVLLAGVGFTNE